MQYLTIKDICELMETFYIHVMKKYTVSLLLVVVAIGLSACIKTATDTFDPFIGDFKGTLTDSDLVTHQVTIHSSYPLNVSKLTSTRIGLGSDSAGITDFYADVAITGADLSGTIPGQTSDTITLQGITVSGLGQPSGTTLAYAGASRQLIFAYRMGYTTMSGGKVVVYKGIKQ